MWHSRGGITLQGCFSTAHVGILSKRKEGRMHLVETQDDSKKTSLLKKKKKTDAGEKVGLLSGQ